MPSRSISRRSAGTASVVAVDTSTIAFLRGDRGKDVEALDRGLESSQVVLPPVVLVEILSDPKLDPRVSRLLSALPLLQPHSGFWKRAATTRAKVLARRLRARLADTLISQSCIDYGTPLITRDADFRHFARYAGLHLA